MKLISIQFLIFLFCSLLCRGAELPDHLVFIGTSTFDEDDSNQGIYSLRLDRKSGKLTRPELVATATTNPAFLELSPDRNQLYATVVLDEPVNSMEGGVSAYTINHDTGGLTLVNTLFTGGNVVAHVAVDVLGQTLLVPNYGSGSVASFSLREDGGLDALKTLISMTGGSGVNLQRQKTPCPHAVVLSPDNRFLFVPALGQDKTLRFKLNTESATIELDDPAAYSNAPGAGPRHAKFSRDGKTYYSLNELDGTVDVLEYEPTEGRLIPLQTISGLPADFKGTNFSAEIRIHPNDKFVYTSNRGHDSISVFSRDAKTGRLTLIETKPCGGQHPRNFALSPDGSWLLCANRDTNNLVVFAVDQRTGRLSPTGEETSLVSAYCVLFVN